MSLTSAMRSPVPNRASSPALILLVDDNQNGVAARRAVLEDLGYKVQSARSGAEALELVKQQNFDLIVTDYKMSPVDGKKLIATLRDQNFSKPIILLSGLANALGFSPENTRADAVIQKSANEIAHLVRDTKRLLTPKKPSGSQRRRAPRGRTGAQA